MAPDPQGATPKNRKSSLNLRVVVLKELMSDLLWLLILYLKLPIMARMTFGAPQQPCWTVL